MFWGLILKANKKYTQTLEKPFHLSQAALDVSCSDDQPVQVMYYHEDSSYLLCTLQKGKTMQCALDLNFAQGDQLCFLTKGGNGIVHLTGFLIPEEDLNYDEFYSEGSEEEDEALDVPDLREKLSKSNKVAKSNGKVDGKKAQPKKEEESDSEEEEDGSDEEELDSSALMENDDDDDESGEDEEESGEEEDEESEEEEEIAPPKAKQLKMDQPSGDKKKDKKQQQQQQNGTAGNKDKKSKENDKTGQIQKLQGGLLYQELKVGNGAEAKVGKKIQVYYVGRLKSNNKIFDQTSSGPGFKMILGRGEVIKGWDLGLVGMKVGGKRRLICPPQLAYGHKGNPPVIPANSTLVFDVELKNVL